MFTTYHHTQFGSVMVAVLGAGCVAVVVALAGGPVRADLVVLLLVLGACLPVFSSLTTEVNERGVHCHFGVGLIRRNIAFAEIQAVSVVRNSWLNGWGLRMIPGGWLWNVSGLDAVELELRDGGRFRMGTDDADEFCARIKQRFKPS